MELEVSVTSPAAKDVCKGNIHSMQIMMIYVDSGVFFINIWGGKI